MKHARYINEYSNYSKTPNNNDVIPYVDEAIKIIDDSGLHFRVGPLETTVQGNE